jgi:hypothetical protein
MDKIKSFFAKIGQWFKKTFSKLWKWALANKVAAIAIGAGSVVAITLAIVLPVSLSAPKRKHVHTFEEGWSTTTTSHWHAPTCGHDVKDSEGEHEFGDWTVTDNKHEHTCSVCGYKVSADHEWGEWHISASSNKIDERECSVCGKVESRAHEHNYVVDKFVWQAMPRGYNVDAYYSCSLTDDLHLNGFVTPTEVERVDATDTADGHVKYHVEFTTPSGNKATEDKEFVLHRPDEHGFCLNCGEYAGETFSCEETGSFSLYLGRPLAGDKLYFRCDLLSGHSLYLSDSDYGSAAELEAYVKNGDLFSYAALDSEATINTGEDGYVYIVFEAKTDRTADDFLNFTREHTETSFGLCLSDYVYSGKTYQVGQEYEINTKAAANKEYASFRFPIEKNHHYYLQLKDGETSQVGFAPELGHGAKGWLAVNHYLTEFPFVENSIIDEDYDYEPELIEIGDEIGDGYFYVRIRANDSAKGMTLHLTIKEHFEVEDFEMCPGEIYVASLDEEIVLGEVGEGGHRIMSTDDTMYFRIKEGIAPNHTYFIDTNGFGPDIVNLYFWDWTTAGFEPLDDYFRDGNNFTFPNTEMTSPQIYIEVAPTEALTDASITVSFEHHPGISCVDSHGFCKYIPDEYMGHTLTYNEAFPSFTFGANSYRYFKVSKAGFEGYSRFVIKSEFDLLFKDDYVEVDVYYMRSDGSWWPLGSSGTSVGSHAVIYYDLGEKYNNIDGDIYLVLHNTGAQVNNVDDLLVYGLNS